MLYFRHFSNAVEFFPVGWALIWFESVYLNTVYVKTPEPVDESKKASTHGFYIS
jgi:hypothetical protein